LRALYQVAGPGKGALLIDCKGLGGLIPPQRWGWKVS
jgi:hypothetical protein